MEVLGLSQTGRHGKIWKLRSAMSRRRSCTRLDDNSNLQPAELRPKGRGTADR